MIKSKLAIFALFFSVGASAQVTVPNTFSAGTAASAAQVNVNFAALVSAINATNDRLAKLEGTGIVAADFAGTYRLSLLHTELNPNHIANYVQRGTVTLNSNLTSNYSVSGEGFQFNPNTAVPPSAAPTAGAFGGQTTGGGTSTWSYSSALLNIVGMGDFFVTAGGKILIRAGSSGNATNGTPGGTDLIILSRL